MHVLPKPKKGKWIVVLEKLDASPKIKKAKKSKAPVKAVLEITGGDEAENETGEKEVYELPYGWTKEVVYRRNQPSMRGKIRQDISVIGPGSKGKKFQSDVKLQRYLQENRDIECDLSVTSTSKKKHREFLLEVPGVVGDASTKESKSNQIFELDTSIPNKIFEEIVIKEEWDEHE